MQALYLYSSMVFVLALAGSVIPFLARRGKKDRRFRFFVSFGAGVLIGAAILHMVPHAAEMSGGSVGLWMMLGFLFLYLLETFTFSHSCEEHGCDHHTIGHVAAVGLAVHNFVNGVALGSAAHVADLGLWVFVATAAHKMPEFFSLSTILLAGRRSRGTVLGVVTAVAGTFLAGALLSGWVLSGEGHRFLGAALGFSAGTFIHLATADLVPEVHHLRQSRWAHVAAFLGGIAVMAVSAMFGHHHG
jgi:zinc transporter ZupT